MPSIRYSSPKRMTTLAGVYLIVNIANGRIYVGSSCSIKARIQDHLKNLRVGRHSNRYLQRAWRFYGSEVFKFEVLETCSSSSLVEREQYWLDELRAAERGVGYNLVRTAGGGYSRYAVKIGIKASIKVTKGVPRPLEVRLKIGEGQRGIPKSEKHRENVKKSHWRNRPDWQEIVERSAAKHRGKKLSEEHKKKIGASHWANGENAETVREKLVRSLTGSKRTPEQRRNISLARSRAYARKKRQRILDAMQTESAVHGTTA